MKILVVEDDRAVAQTLQLLFSSYNYAVDIAVDGETGLHMADAFEYDLILLDLILPKLDGISLCQMLRSQGLQMPILLLTGQGTGAQKAIALNTGADDYVVKPFDAEELIARVQALLRRGTTIGQPILTWGPLSIDPSSHRVSYGTHLLSLPPKVYAILELFLRNPSKTFSPQAILDHVWCSMDSPGEESVRVHIKELRQRLAEVGAPKDMVKTLHRVGYRLNPMYSSMLATQVEHLTVPQVAELKSVNEELRSALEQLHLTQAELRQKNQELELAYQTIEQERQQLQIARDKLELRVVERTVELVKADHSSQQQQHQWQALFDHALDAIAITDDQGRYVDANAAACRLFGLSKADLLQSSVADFMDVSAAEVAHTWKCFLHQGQMSGEVRLRRRDGGVREAEFTAIAHFIPGRHLSILRDISDRKWAETQLCQREDFFNRVYDVAEQAIFVVQVTDTQDFHYISCNRLARQYGRINYRTVWDKTPETVFGPEIGASFRRNYERCLQMGTILSYEEYLVFDDRPIWTFTTLSPLRNSQGVIEYIVGTAIEITDRKQLELSLQTSKAQLSQILDSAIAAIASFRVLDTGDWEYEYFSSGCEGLYGYTIEELMADKHLWLSRVFPEDRDTVLMPLFQEFFAERNTTGEFRFYHKDGTMRWISSTHASQKITDQCWQVTVVSHDITDRKLAEQKIREQATLLDIASDAIIVSDLNHRILYWNQGAERLYGWAAAEVMGQDAHRLFQTPEAQITSLMQRLLDRGEWHGEIRKVTQTGQDVIVATRWTLVRDEGGQPRSILSVDTDVTEKKQLEAQFYHAQRLESLGTLASGISHDLNNVLTPILAIAQLLRLKHNLDMRSQEMLQVLEDSARRGTNLVKQILTFTRESRGDRIPVQIAALVREVVEVIRQTFPKSITICEASPHQPMGLVSADPIHLHQVVMNLCVNARDAMPQGGTLTLCVETCYVDPALAQMQLDAQVGTYGVLTVTDTGHGIPPDIRDRIFEPFFTTKQIGQGTGLGLSTVLGIVKSYGGFVQVWSEVGQGSRFSVYLPLVEGVPTEREPGIKLMQGNGELILVVDDDPAVRQANQLLLESHHYQTWVASDGAEAIALYAKYQADIQVVLMDIMMPNMDGIAVIRALRTLNPALNIIAISGWSSHQDAVLEVGANVFLQKPYNLDQLLGHLHRLLHAPSP